MMEELRAGSEFAGYRLERRLGSGGFATVWRARKDGHVFAVKVFDGEFTRRDTLRLRHEVELLAANAVRDCPHIVRVLDGGVAEDGDGELIPYLVMEYIEGKNLGDHMKEVTGPLPFQNAVIFIIESLNAIGYAHSNGFVHMDLKPSNIMLSTENEIKVIDFGISMDLNKEKHAEIMGTPYYMSPEQIEGIDIDHRTDIYSMGVTIYELITGKPPFADAKVSREHLLEMIKTVPLPLVKTNNVFDKPLLKGMNHIIQKSTAKDPDDRYQTCGEFINDLAEIL